MRDVLLRDCDTTYFGPANLQYFNGGVGNDGETYKTTFVVAGLLSQVECKIFVLDGGWGSMLGPIAQNVLAADVAETDAGWMGFWGALAGMAAGILFGFFSDGSFEIQDDSPVQTRANLIYICQEITVQ